MDNPFVLLEERLSNIENMLLNIVSNLPKGDDEPTGRPLTIKELCEYLDVTEPTVLRWRKKGKIPFFHIGTAVRFNLKDVIKSLEKK